MPIDTVTRMKFSGPISLGLAAGRLGAEVELSLEHRIDYHDDGGVRGQYFMLVLTEEQFDKLGGERVGT